LYWFNLAQVLGNELLAGATIAVPSALQTLGDILRIASKVMFGSFLSALPLNVFLTFISPVVLYSHWWSVAVGFTTFLSTLLLVCAAGIATVMSIGIKVAANAQSDLNIGADIGVQMFAFMYLAAGFSLLAFVTHVGLCCCCRSVRDVRSGRKSVLIARNRSHPGEKGSTTEDEQGDEEGISKRRRRSSSNPHFRPMDTK
jgi:UPF0716 family protein affecting phage T7 exclusion